MVVPSQAKGLSRKTALVAWKDSIEARRATSFALPLLQTSENVIVAGIAEGNVDRNAALSSVNDVVVWLQGHGIVASALVPDAVGNASREIETIARQTSADIIVAGAYSRAGCASGSWAV